MLSEARDGEWQSACTYPDENTFSVAQESQYLKEKAESEREIELLAIVDGVIAGTAGIEAIGMKYKVRHQRSEKVLETWNW